MKIIEDNKRFSMLGLAKFVAALAIVFFHLLPAGSKGTSMYLLVEFFLFVTGYFTYKHFVGAKKEKTSTGASNVGVALKYTFKKVMTIMPYILIAVVLRYIFIFATRHDSFSQLTANGVNLLADVTMFGCLMPREYGWSLWYMSATTLVMPVLILLAQSKRRETILTILLPFLVLYYVSYFSGMNAGVAALVRAFAGFLTGAYIYHLAEYIKKHVNSRALLYVVLFISIIVTAISLTTSTANEFALYYRTAIFVGFAFALAIFLSGKTIFSKITSPTMDYLEQVSMVIYLTHVPIQQLMLLTSVDFLASRATMLVYVLAIAVGNIILYKIVQLIRAKCARHPLQKNA